VALVDHDATQKQMKLRPDIFAAKVFVVQNPHVDA
jgi:hypothetical protein